MNSKSAIFPANRINSKYAIFPANRINSKYAIFPVNRMNSNYAIYLCPDDLVAIRPVTLNAHVKNRYLSSAPMSYDQMIE
jgi:hypothetical protein